MTEQTKLIEEPRMTDLTQDIKDALAKGPVKVKITYTSGTEETRRMFERNGIYALFKTGSSKRGYRLDWYDIQKIVLIKEKAVDEATIWRKKLLEMKKRLEASGLWADILSDVNIAIDVGYEKLDKAYHQYWVRHEGTSLAEEDKRNCELIKELDARLVKADEKGVDHPDTSIIWYLAKIPKIKKMFFGRDNEHHLKIIEEGLKNKIKTNTEATASYDVSFNYEPEKMMAWYSEEYRGCGNGHYYLALDSTHAWFYEDD
jgi:hypothetical protein